MPAPALEPEEDPHVRHFDRSAQTRPRHGSAAPRLAIPFAIISPAIPTTRFALATTSRICLPASANNCWAWSIFIATIRQRTPKSCRCWATRELAKRICCIRSSTAQESGWQLLVTPGTYQKDTDFLEYLLFQVIDTLLGGGTQHGHGRCNSSAMT